MCFLRVYPETMITKKTEVSVLFLHFIIKQKININTTAVNDITQN